MKDTTVGDFINDLSDLFGLFLKKMALGIFLVCVSFLALKKQTPIYDGSLIDEIICYAVGITGILICALQWRRFVQQAQKPLYAASGLTKTIVCILLAGVIQGMIISFNVLSSM